MKNHLVRYLLFGLLLTFACSLANAQNDTLSAAAGDRYVISAKAGGVNFVEGAVNVARAGGPAGRLVKGEKLEIGDRVSTGPDGKAEILLNPGSYLRLGGNSTFAFKNVSLDDLELRIEKGSAILEVFAAEEFKVSVDTPSTTYTLIQTGVFRVDVVNDQRSSLEVWKGAARAAGTDEIKSGRVATTAGVGVVSVAKFDRDDKDALDIWSKERSKELAKITARLKRDELRTALMRSFLGRGWNMFGSFGLWVLDPFSGGYCFLPFGRGWNSPYGYGYGHGMWWYDMPSVVYYSTGPWGPHQGGGSSSPVATPITSAGDRSPIPPFIRMEQTMGGGGLHGGSPDRGGSSYDPGSGSYSSPTSSSSSSSSSSGGSSSSAATGVKSDPTGSKP
ncbi:MAG TPA: FecR family protein [Pyrinomonadaceae bacterium]|nr:FecR family protein [Pyrinomonadaceae bacterium]